MYYTARSRAPGSAGLQCIGRAVSERPEGPFRDEQSTPLICDTDKGGSVDGRSQPGRGGRQPVPALAEPRGRAGR
jgi:hypothetical protein